MGDSGVTLDIVYNEGKTMSEDRILQLPAAIYANSKSVHNSKGVRSPSQWVSFTSVRSKRELIDSLEFDFAESNISVEAYNVLEANLRIADCNMDETSYMVTNQKYSYDQSFEMSRANRLRCHSFYRILQAEAVQSDK
ncbi:hypothetical protein FEM48_Zijuj07G0039900 [Ziziphus jujuba var. spinosa]|uniref:Uncharacterized protein n=1 Tax=Ziziphus jujuba var. spinosa TaxID=714518 RepID=A0A978V2B5_ZIZJJ|nr:hypothetical protein FEM48_Zijuj07G0039900 [Ziziphus jujuba var. spinosa]